MIPPHEFPLETLLSPYPPKAGHLIVTIYGDIVEPRGGTVWVGDLITLCGQFGVNESLVRTAVSRLVARDQLQGEREGRRSYYGLTATAQTAYHMAGEQIFGAPDSDCSLLMVVQPDKAEHDKLLEQGFGAAGDNLFIGADRPGRIVTGARFRAFPDRKSDREIQALLDYTFDLKKLSAAYLDFIERFRRIGGVKARNLEALTLRLAMVHAYRAIRLTDPQLPPSVLPEDWPGWQARSLFAETYVRLSVTADAYIGKTLQGRDTLLAARPAAAEKRLAVLQTNA